MVIYFFGDQIAVDEHVGSYEMPGQRMPRVSIKLDVKTTINTILQLYASCDILGEERWQVCNAIAQFSVKFKNQCV